MASTTAITTTASLKSHEINEPLTEFALFRKLPIAIRCRVYGYIDTPYAEAHVHAIRGFPTKVLKDKAPNSQPIEPSPPSQLQWPNAEHVFPEQTPITYFTWNLQGGRFFSTTAPKVHPLLHTCKESRKYFTQKHNLVHAFGTLINLDRDIIFLDASTAIHHAEVNNPGIEAFAELLRHPELIKKIKHLAFHAEVRDYLWLGKCAEKMKGLLTDLEEVYLVWADDGRHTEVQKKISKISGNSLFFIDVSQEGFEHEFQFNKEMQNEMKAAMEQRWTIAAPDHKVSKTKIPTFKHVFAKEPVFGLDHGVVSYREFVLAQPPKPAVFVRASSTASSLHRKAIKNSVSLHGYKY
ncbi:hypothetical protein L207DRAFT_572245 [Hyaloscypha variabilis F]|uniref:2EXR domain-containing protein n=1 Tax=Hyaloscypha variabilis (strain UAMH 11265 / GT02V1 / F) TaxID=1149755 RepID=A0A2J6R1W4_HYAVF|nr:hypothetical protein L207DRAFT_572245 [Hyaloscypha variabilis F]